jgi:hypothetical protein
MWTDALGDVGNGLNLFRYSRAGRYDGGVASFARCLSCTRRLPATTEAFLSAGFLGTLFLGTAGGLITLRRSGTGPGVTVEVMGDATGLLDCDASRAPVRGVEDDGVVTLGVGDVGRDMKFAPARRPSVLPAIRWKLILGRGRFGKGSEGGCLGGDSQCIIAVFGDVAAGRELDLGTGNKKERLRCVTCLEGNCTVYGRGASP